MMRRALYWAAMAVLCLSAPASARAEERHEVKAAKGETPEMADTRLLRQPAIDAQPALDRPRFLPALYAGYGALHALDLWSTAAALERGAREANPVLAPIGGNQMATIAVKAATTGATIYFVERLWRKNRVAAVVLMAGINGATAAVVARNARNARR